MSLVVLSCDVYFTQSMQALQYIDEQENKNLCIIDIDSFASLHDIIDHLIAELASPYHVIFVKGAGIISKVLSPLQGITRKASLAEFSDYFRKGEKFTLENALTILNNLRELRNLTQNEISAACALHHQEHISVVSKHLNCSNKALYQRISIIARKMNLRHINQIQYFIHREFTREELQKMS